MPHHHRREEQERRDGEEFKPEPWHLVDQRLQRRHPGLPIGVMPKLVQELLLAAADLHVLGPTEPLLHVLDDHFRVVPLGGGPATGSGPRDRVEQPCGGRQHASHDDRAGGLEPEKQPDQSAQHERLGDGHEEEPADLGKLRRFVDGPH